MTLMLDLQPSLGPALVVGGGAVALRKVRSLVEAGFDVVVIAPDFAPELTALPITRFARVFQDSDLPVGEYGLVFACTGDRVINRRVGELARSARVPVVVADAPVESTAFSPAVHRDGALTIAVSTGGGSPAFAATVRDRIAASLGDGLASAVESARGERDARLGRQAPP